MTAKIKLKEQMQNETGSRKGKKLVAQSCLTLCNPMDCSLPASSVYGILQARVLEWVAMRGDK